MRTGQKATTQQTWTWWGRCVGGVWAPQVIGDIRLRNGSSNVCCSSIYGDSSHGRHRKCNWCPGCCLWYIDRLGENSWWQWCSRGGCSLSISWEVPYASCCDSWVMSAPIVDTREDQRTDMHSAWSRPGQCITNDDCAWNRNPLYDFVAAWVWAQYGKCRTCAMLCCTNVTHKVIVQVRCPALGEREGSSIVEGCNGMFNIHHVMCWGWAENDFEKTLWVKWISGVNLSSTPLICSYTDEKSPFLGCENYPINCWKFWWKFIC
jgi:hypothetical protein